MSIELAHVPTFIKEAAGKLHRYVNSGEALAKSELQRLMAELHKLIEHVPDEPKAAAVEVAPAQPAAAPESAPAPAPQAPEAAPVAQDPVTQAPPPAADPAQPAPPPAA